MLVRNALMRIRESEQATGEIRISITLEFEQDRVGPAFDPDFAADHAFDAIINLSAYDAIMNAKRHGEIMRRRTVWDNIFVAGFSKMVPPPGIELGSTV